MPRAHISTPLLTLLLLALGCTYEAGQVTTHRGVTVTLTLAQDGAGNLDCQLPATCEDLPYGGDCAALEIDVDTATGRTCQRCVHDNGAVTDQGCDDSVIGCVVVTLPDPDCVVCAYVNGSVVFSTCQAQEPDECIEYFSSDGVTCERCFDPTGRIIFDSCMPDCSDVVCAAVACGSGTQPWRVPGDCCEQCIPIDACEEVVCPLDYPVPDCPSGTGLVRDPIDCCTYRCLPNECPPDDGTSNLLPPLGCMTHADCPEFTLCIEGLCEYGGGTGEVCPPGFVWRDEYPFCGQCVERNDDRLCMADSECFPGEICVYQAGMCEGAPIDPGGTTDPPAACYGVCRPENPMCNDTPGVDPTFAPCEGDWIIDYDENGCQYPICLCFDGSVSLDGVCRDQCENVDCIQVVPPDCGADFHLEDFYPYCCGVCVPNNPCAFAEGMTAPPDNAPVWTCGEVLCAPGYHQEVDTATCCSICVPDMDGACTSNYDCAFGEYCTVEDDVCNMPPECGDPSGNGGCAGVCYGECAPYDDLPPNACEDSDGGIVPEVAGVVAFIDGVNGTWVEQADTCTPDGNAVIETYCSQGSDGNFVQEVVIECHNSATGSLACVEGACVR